MRLSLVPLAPLVLTACVMPPPPAPAGAASAAAPPTASSPPTTLPELTAPLTGPRVTVDGTPMSIVVPTGWRSGWHPDGEAYVISPAHGRTQALVAATAYPLDAAEAAGPIDALVAGALRDLDAAVQVETVEYFTVRGRAGARAIARAGDRGLLATALVVDAWAVVLVAVHAPAAAAEARAVSDTVIATLEGTPPAAEADTATAAAPPTAGAGPLPTTLVGCWSYYYASRTSGGGSSSVRIAFTADGRYRWRSHTSMPGMYREPTIEEGSVAVHGDQLALVADSGERLVKAYALDGATLVFDGMRLTRAGCP